MGMTVHALTRSGVTPRREIYREPDTGDPDGILPDRVFTRGQEQEFLAGLDFLILAMPLTAATEGIVGEAELRALPRRAYLLNPARGPLIQEHSLLAALTEGWIAGAAIDTHYAYPLPSEHPLWRLPNVILTPHISGSSLNPRYGERIWRIFSDNVARYQAGGPLLNELTREQINGG
jgi:phosphoglycerate dehydrogenase-like enzyme